MAEDSSDESKLDEEQQMVEEEQQIVEKELAMWGKSLGIAHQKQNANANANTNTNANKPIIIKKEHWCSRPIQINSNSCVKIYSDHHKKWHTSTPITHIINMCIITNNNGDDDKCCSIEDYVGVLTKSGSIYINRCGIEPSNIKSLSVPTIDIIEEDGIRLSNQHVIFK